MKLTKREKVLLCILLVTIVFYALYTFIFSRDNSDETALQDQYSQTLDEYNAMRQNILDKTGYEKEIKKLNFQINQLSNGFLNKIEQEQVIVFMDDYLLQNGIYTNSISFTDVTDVPVQVSTGSDSTQATSGEQNGQNDSTDNAQTVNIAKSMTLNLTYKAPYDNVLSFIDDLQSNAIDIAISNMNFTATDDGQIQGNMTITFYSIDKLTDTYYEEWVWHDLIVSGVYNPFYKEVTPTTANEQASGGDSNNTTDTKQYDFIMTAKPTSSDLPTLVFGKTNDNTRDSYVYADSNNIENLNVDFKVEDGTYYYRYNTTDYSYPTDGSYKEFTPCNEGEIDIIVYSTARNSDADTSGVKVNISNNAMLRVNVHLVDEDKTRPRISFESLKGIVIN